MRQNRYKKHAGEARGQAPRGIASGSFDPFVPLTLISPDVIVEFSSPSWAVRSILNPKLFAAGEIYCCLC